jgi:hypothetical protein
MDEREAEDSGVDKGHDGGGRANNVLQAHVNRGAASVGVSDPSGIYDQAAEGVRFALGAML